MKLREALAPQVALAEKRYPEILHAILSYTQLVDEHGDAELTAYRELEARLHQWTGKDMATFNLWDWWEEEGAEVLAFRIALPDPVITPNSTKAELAELVRRLKTDPVLPESAMAESSFGERFAYYLSDYYHGLLKINFSSYNHVFFNRQRDGNGNYYELTAEEIVNRIWGNKEN